MQQEISGDPCGVASITRKVFAHAAGLYEDEIRDDMPLSELGIDSVLTASAVAILELELDVRIPPQDIEGIFGTLTVADAIAAVNRLVTTRDSAKRVPTWS